MNVFLFGNADLPEDNLPFRIRKYLEKRFPEITFITMDPNEMDAPPEDPFILIDTVRGLDRPAILRIEDIAAPDTRLTAHDFDLAATLLLFRKLHPSFEALIIGIPSGMRLSEAQSDACRLLKILIR